MIGAVIYFVNTFLSLILAITIIEKLYISKKFSKEKDFHFYNDLFSWEIFFFFMTAENLLKIISVFLPLNIISNDILLRIRISILFFPFWNKIIHLEKVMDKITYEKHYLAGLIPFIIVIILSISGLPNLLLLYIFFSSSFIPYVLFLILLRNTGMPKSKSLEIILGITFVGMGIIFQPEIFLVNLMNIIAPLKLIIGTLLIFDSFRKELFVSVKK